jgi:hypothetical protein
MQAAAAAAAHLRAAVMRAAYPPARQGTQLLLTGRRSGGPAYATMRRAGPRWGRACLLGVCTYMLRFARSNDDALIAKFEFSLTTNSSVPGQKRLSRVPL